jgi:hypothetical protein
VSRFHNMSGIALANEANDHLNVNEAASITKLMDTLRDPKLKVYIAETICEETGWYEDADSTYLSQTGAVLKRCALIATGKGN